MKLTCPPSSPRISGEDFSVRRVQVARGQAMSPQTGYYGLESTRVSKGNTPSEK